MLFVTDLKATQKLYNSYIQDLITYLRDDEDPVKLDIGLSTAERLICDKTNVGSELSKSTSFLSFCFPNPRSLVQLPQQKHGTEKN